MVKIVPPVGVLTSTQYSVKYVPVTDEEPEGVVTDPDCRVESPEVEDQKYRFSAETANGDCQVKLCIEPTDQE